MSICMARVCIIALLLVNSSSTISRPNFILWVSDDMPFIFPDAPEVPPKYSHPSTAETPNHTTMREDSLVFTRAYTAGPKCAPSRYSFITMKFCSRSIFGIQQTIAQYLGDTDPLRSWSGENLMSTFDFRSANTIDYCKISETDFSQNLPTELLNAGYETIMVGKWHLIPGDAKCYDDYEASVNLVKNTGFSRVDGLYCSNIGQEESNDRPFNHNMEWVLDAALKNIDEVVEDGNPFFLYIAPTPPNAIAGDSYCDDALLRPLTETPAGTLNYIPNPGMPSRESVIERAMSSAGGDRDVACSNLQAGVIWMDDALGALLVHLEEKNILDNTFILVTTDHGMVSKGHIYEGGARLFQWIRYPPLFQQGAQTDLLVSNIDIGATILDIAGVTPSYVMDGRSFKDEAAQLLQDTSRTLITEIASDRAIVGQRYKYVSRSWNDNHEMANPGYYPAYDDAEQIYDLLEDGAEQNNLAYLPAYSNILDDFRNAMQAHDIDVGFTLENGPVQFSPVVQWYEIAGRQTIVDNDAGPAHTNPPSPAHRPANTSPSVDEQCAEGSSVYNQEVTIPRGVKSGQYFSAMLNGTEWSLMCPDVCEEETVLDVDLCLKLSQPRAYSVTIPNGVKSGQAFRLVAENRHWTLTCPEGLQPGDTMLFQLP